MMTVMMMMMVMMMVMIMVMVMVSTHRLEVSSVRNSSGVRRKETLAAIVRDSDHEHQKRRRVAMQKMQGKAGSNAARGAPIIFFHAPSHGQYLQHEATRRGARLDPLCSGHEAPG